MATIDDSKKSELGGLTLSFRRLIPALLTGQVAALIMAVAVMGVFAIVFGKNPLYPVQVIGSALFGEAALVGINIQAIIAGLILHQAGPTILWSILFGGLALQLDIRNTRDSLLLGLATGVVSMTGPYLLMPIVFSRFGVDIWNREVPMFWDWTAHLIFGASFALYPFFLKKQAK